MRDPAATFTHTQIPLAFAMSPTLPFKISTGATRIPYSPRLPSAFPNLRIFVPHKVRRKWRATKGRLRVGQSPASNVFALQTSFSPAETIQALRRHQWSLYDFQYFGLAVLGIFCLSIMQEPGPMLKTLIATCLMISLILPVTRQFFLPFLPIAAWLIFWFSCKYVHAPILSTE